MVVTRHKVVGAHTDDHADMAGADEAIQAQVWRVKNGFHRGNNGDVIAEDGEILDAFGLCSQEGHGGRGGGGLKANGEEDHLAIRILASKLEASSGE